jgi:hypothetical protein
MLLVLIAIILPKTRRLLFTLIFHTIDSQNKNFITEDLIVYEDIRLVDFNVSLIKFLLCYQLSETLYEIFF